MYTDRYVYDCLYGTLRYPDYIWKTAVCPELQRLREVRLCNINSLCLTGGANINRYEHALGTAHLALSCLDSWSAGINGDTRRLFALACLLHDVGSTAFGHSVQYVLAAKGYEHESLNDMFSFAGGGGSEGYRYQHALIEPIYFGLPRRLGHLLSEADLTTISAMVAGEHPLGPLLNGTIDLDNIDNVYRLAYHIGLTGRTDTPIALARSLGVRDGKLIVDENAKGMLVEWYELRKRLYHYLLLNPDEFGAKCMLEEALQIAQAKKAISFNWCDVDYQLVEKLAGCSDEVNAIVSRLMVGDIYGCAGIYAASQIGSYDAIIDPARRRLLEADITLHVRGLKFTNSKSATVALHAIKDVNKTEREISVLTDAGRRITIGSPSRRVLIGVFFRNVHLSMSSVGEEMLLKAGVQRTILDRLRAGLQEETIQQLRPYAEATMDGDVNAASG